MVQPAAVEIAYWSGLAYEAMGDYTPGDPTWTKATAAPQAGGAARGGGGRDGSDSAAMVSGQSYYQAMCLQKLGEVDKAKSMFQSLVDSGQKALEQPWPLRRVGAAGVVVASKAAAVAARAEGRSALRDRPRLRGVERPGEGESRVEPGAGSES